MRVFKKDVAITNFDEWKTHAKPKSTDHWVRGRSAYECAAAWCGSNGLAVPAELEALFAGDEFASFAIDNVQPEHRIKFDDLAGEPRNADVAIEAHDNKGRIAITIEAKADEPFGETLDDALIDALEAKLENTRSGAVQRIEQLVHALFTPRVKKLPRLSRIRYQLMTSVAGTLAFADDLTADRAICVIHQFKTPETKDKLIATNEKDLDAFVQRITNGSVSAMPTGRIVGPFTVPGKPLFEGPRHIYIAKIVRDCT